MAVAVVFFAEVEYFRKLSPALNPKLERTPIVKPQET